ncbi:hypothetical protein CSX04_00610 [Burkholderia cepacia]|nr:hypothetical protein CSX04_00610 [Burkholderia cepacia]
MRLALRVLAHLHERERVGHAFPDLVLRRAFLLQAERDVRFDRHVREQRVRLEHHVDRAAVRRQRREVLAVDEDLAGGGRLEPGEHAQQRRLAAARAAEQREQLVLRDRQVHVVDSRAVAEFLHDVFDADEGVVLGTGRGGRLGLSCSSGRGYRLHGIHHSFFTDCRRERPRARRVMRLAGNGSCRMEQCARRARADGVRGSQAGRREAMPAPPECFAISGPSSAGPTDGSRGAGCRPASASSAPSSSARLRAGRRSGPARRPA